MHLRHLVPALGILASTTGAAFAENVGGLSVGGFVDTIGTYRDQQGDKVPSSDTFAAAVELRLGYSVGSKVKAQVDVEWNNGSYNGHPDQYLEQAYINYAFADKLSLTAGKFTTYAGWVAADADGLFRVNGGPITQLYGGELVGGAVNYAPSDDLGVSLFLVNGLDLSGVSTVALNSFGTAGIYGDDSTNTNRDRGLSPAIDVVYKVKDIGTFNLEGGYDYQNSDQTIISLGANATIKLASYQPLTLGAEVIWQQAKNDTGATSREDTNIGALLMANHTIPMAPCKASATAMVQHLELKSDDGVPATADQKGRIDEFSLAILTNPTNDPHFGVNAEVAYQIESDRDVRTGANASDNARAVTVSLEAIAVIP